MLSIPLLISDHVTDSSVVFQTPPPVLPAYQVLPVGSDTSTSIGLVLPGTLNGPLSMNVAFSFAYVLENKLFSLILD